MQTFTQATLSQITFDQKQLDQAQRQSANRYKTLFTAGNSVMLSAFTTTVLTVLMAYIFPHYFSISLQVLAHIFMILAVTAIKIGYLMRCIGLHGLGARQL